jgi:hypothetical protein
MSAHRASRPVSQMNPCKTTLLANVRLPNVSIKENTANENNTFEIQPTLVTDASNFTDFIRQTAAKHLKAEYPSEEKVLILGQNGLLTELQQDFQKNYLKTQKMIDMFFATNGAFEPLNWFSKHMKLNQSVNTAPVYIEFLNSEQDKLDDKEALLKAQEKFQKLYDDYQSLNPEYENLEDAFSRCENAVTKCFLDKNLSRDTKVNYYDFADRGSLYSHPSLAQTQLKKLFIQLTKFQELIIMLWEDMLYVRNHLEAKGSGFDKVDECTPPIEYDGITSEDSHFIGFLTNYCMIKGLGVDMFPLQHFLNNVDSKEANTKRTEFYKHAIRLMKRTKGIKDFWEYSE